MNSTEIFTIPRTSVRMRTNFLLILGLCAMNLQQTLLEDVCYEKDKAPVELDVLYDEVCLDLEGVIYTLGSELVSCCDCFRLVRDPLYLLIFKLYKNSMVNHEVESKVTIQIQV